MIWGRRATRHIRGCDGDELMRSPPPARGERERGREGEREGRWEGDGGDEAREGGRGKGREPVLDCLFCLQVESESRILLPVFFTSQPSHSSIQANTSATSRTFAALDDGGLSPGMFVTAIKSRMLASYVLSAHSPRSASGNRPLNPASGVPHSGGAEWHIALRAR
jgi:hypothetical protein